MRCSLSFISASFLFLNIVDAHADSDRIRVDRLKKQDIAYMSRGWSYVPQACANEIINEIRDFDTGKYWYIILDDTKSEIQFERPDTGHKEICNLVGRIEVDPSGKRNFLEIQ